MSHDMEKPDDPADLFHAYGEDVNPARSIITGDVFADVAVTEIDGGTTIRTVMILEHPCSLRADGINLKPRLHAAEVHPTTSGSWRGNFNRMFLPQPFPRAESKAAPHAAFFDAGYYVTPDQLSAATRIACLSRVGINLLLQRYVKFQSRLTVPTFEFQNANYGVYEEADLVEEWCLDREQDGIKTEDAVAECISWLRDTSSGRMPQELLGDPQHRSTVRRMMRNAIKELRRPSQT
ncbi:hypothetical protein ACIQRE_16795 [Streptomyces griseoluteus]|uniref:hypothetical protein n=1 Tax=Streptomyces griseoluteus TaxID=29306 RepID=UPI00382ABBB4